MDNTTIQNLWPSQAELPADAIIDLMREQGELLPDATDGLLRAVVRFSSIHVPYTATLGAFVPATPKGVIETVSYYIRPVNDFLGSAEYRLFSFVREIGNSYPLYLQIFPDEKLHPLDSLLSDRAPYLSPVISDYKTFLTEFTKVLKSKGVVSLLAGMKQVIEGTHRKDTTQDRHIATQI